MQIHVWTKQKADRIIDAEWEEIIDNEPICINKDKGWLSTIILLGSVIVLRFVYCWTMQIITGVW